MVKFLTGLNLWWHVQLLHFCNVFHVSLYCLLCMVILHNYSNTLYANCSEILLMDTWYSRYLERTIPQWYLSSERNFTTGINFLTLKQVERYWYFLHHRVYKFPPRRYQSSTVTLYVYTVKHVCIIELSFESLVNQVSISYPLRK